MLFEPDEQATWPSSLTVQESLTAVKQGKSTIIDIPVSNITQHDITLPSRLTLGRLQLVRSATPVEVKLKNEDCVPESSTKPTDQAMGKSSPNGTRKSKCKPPEIDLRSLTPDQQRAAIEMLCKEADVFAKDEEDVGHVEELQMNIHPTDSQQKNYLSIPRSILNW